MKVTECLATAITVDESHAAGKRRGREGASKEEEKEGADEEERPKKNNKNNPSSNLRQATKLIGFFPLAPCSIVTWRQTPRPV